MTVIRTVTRLARRFLGRADPNPTGERPASDYFCFEGTQRPTWWTDELAQPEWGDVVGIHENVWDSRDGAIVITELGLAVLDDCRAVWVTYGDITGLGPLSKEPVTRRLVCHRRSGDDVELRFDRREGAAFGFYGFIGAARDLQAARDRGFGPRPPPPIVTSVADALARSLAARRWLAPEEPVTPSFTLEPETVRERAAASLAPSELGIPLGVYQRSERSFFVVCEHGLSIVEEGRPRAVAFREMIGCAGPGKDETTVTLRTSGETIEIQASDYRDAFRTCEFIRTLFGHAIPL